MSSLWDGKKCSLPKKWKDSLHFSKMKQNLNDSLEYPRDFSERQTINLSYIYKALSFFTSW